MSRWLACRTVATLISRAHLGGKLEQLVFAGFVFAKESVTAPVGQLTSHDLVWEGAHVTRTLTLQGARQF